MKISKKDERIAKRLSAVELQQDDVTDDDVLDLWSVDAPSRRRHLFLGYYSETGLRLALSRYGFFHDLKKRGFPNVDLHLDAADPFVHRLTLHDVRSEDRMLLVELVARREDCTLHLPFDHPLQGRRFEVFRVEWLCLQDPTKSFTSSRPRLPGQDHPSLGMARRVLELTVLACRRLELSGILNVPAYFHNAYLFSRVFHYINPIKEAFLVALSRHLKNLNLAEASWAVEWKCVRDGHSGKPFEWMRGPQLAPVTAELNDLFAAPEYLGFVEEVARTLRFELDRAAFQDRMAGISRAGGHSPS